MAFTERLPTMYEYDVFLSFSSKDSDEVARTWQSLSQSGLRVFWSSDTLKEAVGQNWLERIQDSLVKSQHFLLFWTHNARNSNWVEEEYQTFYSQCYMGAKEARRLIILCTDDDALGH